MPLPKPDIDLVQRVLSERKPSDWPDDIFTDIQNAALIAIGDGAITPKRANNLVWALEVNPSAASVFPNNVLHRALLTALEPGGWTEAAEHDLLVFIFAFYSEAGAISESIYPMLEEPLPLFGDIFDAIFDVPAEPVSLHGKICDFTGSFACGPRRKCFEIVAGAGGASSNGRWTDFLFVSEKHVSGRVVSSTIRYALDSRQRLGSPKIYAERFFPSS